MPTLYPDQSLDVALRSIGNYTYLPVVIGLDEILSV